MVTVLAPLAYIGFLAGSLIIFGRIYRKRKAAQSLVDPWFPTHKARDVYISLLSLQKQPPTNVLTAALLRRAMTDIERIITLNTSKQALLTLLQKGQIGDDMWSRFTVAEKELEAEIREVVAEANTFKEGWGTTIFNQASDMHQHEMCSRQFQKIDDLNQLLVSEYTPNKNSRLTISHSLHNSTNNTSSSKETSPTTDTPSNKTDSPVSENQNSSNPPKKNKNKKGKKR